MILIGISEPYDNPFRDFSKGGRNKKRLIYIK
jgi:hypothetical protein